MELNSGKMLRRKEIIAAILVLTLASLGAIFLPAAVGTSPQAGPLSHAVAPWLFGPVQILLLWLPPWLGAVLLPLTALMILLALPWLAKLWGELAATVIFSAMIAGVGLLLIWFLISEYWQ